MIWNIEDFIEIDLTCPGVLFGQYEVVCSSCNCDFVVQETEVDNRIAKCPNCGIDCHMP